MDNDYKKKYFYLKKLMKRLFKKICPPKYDQQFTGNVNIEKSGDKFKMTFSILNPVIFYQVWNPYNKKQNRNKKIFEVSIKDYVKSFNRMQPYYPTASMIWNTNRYVFSICSMKIENDNLVFYTSQRFMKSTAKQITTEGNKLKEGLYVGIYTQVDAIKSKVCQVEDSIPCLEIQVDFPAGDTAPLDPEPGLPPPTEGGFIAQNGGEYTLYTSNPNGINARIRNGPLGGVPYDPNNDVIINLGDYTSGEAQQRTKKANVNPDGDWWIVEKNLSLVVQLQLMNGEESHVYYINATASNGGSADLANAGYDSTFKITLLLAKTEEKFIDSKMTLGGYSKATFGPAEQNSFKNNLAGYINNGITAGDINITDVSDGSAVVSSWITAPNAAAAQAAADIISVGETDGTLLTALQGSGGSTLPALTSVVVDTNLVEPSEPSGLISELLEQLNFDNCSDTKIRKRLRKILNMKELTSDEEE
jgi:hypothetical protein